MYLDSEAYGADKGEEASSYNEFNHCADEECEDVEDDQAVEVGSAADPEQGWG